MCSWSSNVRFQLVCLQRETRSSPAPKVFVSGPHKTRSSLAMNAFVGSVMSCSEVSSRSYLVASDQHVVCSVISNLEVKRVVFWKVGLETTQKRTETRGKKFLEKNFILSRDGAVKSTQTRQG